MGRGEAAYWLPLLAIFTGARLEELGQLRPSDVDQVTYPDGEGRDRSAWVISIKEDRNDGLRIKNAASERRVPVHLALEQLGFLRFVTAAKMAGQDRLFPALKANIYGRVTAKWGEWFSLYKRAECGITDRRMVFHSFRHTFKHYARHVGIVEGVQRQLMGHSSSDAADDYGSGHTLYQLVEGMALYRIPGLNLPEPPPAFR
jgi:integrase